MSSSRRRGAVASFVEALQARGRYAFNADEVAQAVPATPVARAAALRRLVASGRLTRVGSHQPFFVIVPAEYRGVGAPPAAWVLDDYMRFLGAPYYLGLLSAAEWYGATHFALQVTQVVTAVQRRPVRIGRERIQFITKREAAKTPVRHESTPGGPLRVSTPEATMLDLVRYPAPSGGLSSAATAIAVLAVAGTPGGLTEILDAAADVAASQRLGFLLEQLQARRLAAAVERWLGRHPPVRLRALDPGMPVTGCPVARRWSLWENAPIEVTR
jgi:predicted transcriptional regulator of viral defense system